MNWTFSLSYRGFCRNLFLEVGNRFKSDIWDDPKFSIEDLRCQENDKHSVQYYTFVAGGDNHIFYNGYVTID